MNFKGVMKPLFEQINNQKEQISINFCRVDDNSIHLSGYVFYYSKKHNTNQVCEQVSADSDKLYELISNLVDEGDWVLGTSQVVIPPTGDTSLKITFCLVNLICNQTDEEIKKVFEDYWNDTRLYN